MTRNVAGLSPSAQAGAILAVGAVLTVVIFYALTNGFRGVTVSAEYDVLVGR